MTSVGGTKTSAANWTFAPMALTVDKVSPSALDEKLGRVSPSARAKASVTSMASALAQPLRTLGGTVRTKVTHAVEHARQTRRHDVKARLDGLSCSTMQEDELFVAIKTWLQNESRLSLCAGFHLAGPIWMTAAGCCLRVQENHPVKEAWWSLSEAAENPAVLSLLGLRPHMMSMMDAQQLHAALEVCAQRFLLRTQPTFALLEPRANSSYQKRVGIFALGKDAHLSGPDPKQLDWGDRRGRHSTHERQNILKN